MGIRKLIFKLIPKFMFTTVIDNLMVMWYAKYEKNKDKIEQDEEFEKSRERKEMDEFVQAIVVLYQNKTGRYS